MESVGGERFAGHMVTSALIGAGIGLAVRLRPRLGRRVWLLPVSLWLTQVLAHTLYNNAAVGAGIAPGWLQGLYRLWGSGHLERPLLLALLLTAVTVDYKTLHAVTDRLPALPGTNLAHPLTRLGDRAGQRITALPPADAAPIFRRTAQTLGQAVAALAATAAAVWRELAVVLVAASRGPATWWSAMAVMRERRELAVALTRHARPPPPPRDPDTTAHHAAQLRTALAVLAALAVVTAAHTLATHGGESAFLAGLFDRLGQWWNSLPLWQQFLVIGGVAALLTLGGMGFLPALGAVSTASSLAAHGQGIATFIRDPARPPATSSPGGDEGISPPVRRRTRPTGRGPVRRRLHGSQLAGCDTR